MTWDWYCDGADGTTDIVFYSDGTASNTAGSEIEWTAETGTANLSTGACAAVNFSYNAKFTYTYYGTVYYLMVDGDEADGPQDSNGSGTKDGECEMTRGGGGEMCNYSISLYDSYGDGWHGNNFVNLYINGSLYSSYTLSSGSGPETYTFPVDDGDAVHTTFTQGSYSYECYYYIYDSEGNEVAVDGTGSYYDDPPDGVAPFTASCDGGRTSVGTIPVLITKDKIFESSNKSTRLHKSVPWKLNSKNGE
jgi:hypothetical protein